MTTAQKITNENGKLSVPDRPIVPYIEGDGTGPDIWRASVRVLDAAVEKAYRGRRKIEWREVLAGEKAFNQTGNWLPDATIDAFREYLVGIKGPLTTPVGGGIRSLNVALRQMLDLYVCLRPVRYFTGVPSPVKRPEAVDMVIFRENTEDIYAGIEFKSGTPEARSFLDWLKGTHPKLAEKVRFPDTSGIGIKPVSAEGTARLVAAAINYAIVNGRRSVTLVHKGNINGDYISDALAAQVGGIGIAPGGNINYTTGHAIFEATHGTAPKYAGQDKVNPGSVILSGEMMLRYMQWTEAAELIVRGMEGAIAAKTVTYDFARLMEGAREVKCSEFADAVIERMG